MRSIRILTIALSIAGFAHAGEILPTLVTKLGREYFSVEIVSVEPDGLRIKHESGVGTIPFETLPDNLAKKYHFDPKAADEHRKEKASLQERIIDEMDEAARDSDKAIETADEGKPSEEAIKTAIPKSAPNQKTVFVSPQNIKVLAKSVRLSADTVSGESPSGRTTSTIRTIKRERHVSVVVDASTGGRVTVETHFFGKDHSEKAINRVVKVTRNRVTLLGEHPETIDASAMFTETTKTDTKLGTRYRSGVKYAGWVVRVLDSNGKMLAIQGSRTDFIKLVGRPLVKQ